MGNAYKKFNGLNKGKLTSRSNNKTDLSFYNSYQEDFENNLASVHGGFFKRPGTNHTEELSNFGRKSFSLETTDGKEFLISFLSDNNIEIREVTGGINNAVTFTETHSFNYKKINSIQKGNTLILVEKGDYPKILSYDGIGFSFEDVPFNLEPVRIEEQEFTLKNASGTITCTGDYFKLTDVGSKFIMKAEETSATWAYAEILTYISPTQVAVAWLRTPDRDDAAIATGTNGTTFVWRMSMFRDGDYPSKIAFFGGRMAIGGYDNADQVVNLSRSNYPFDFTTANTASGIVSDGEGIYIDILSDEGFALKYLTQTEYGLNCGSSKGVYSAMSGSTENALTPSTLRVNKILGDNCMDLEPINFENISIYGERNHKGLEGSHVSNTGSVASNSISYRADDYFKVDIKRLQKLSQEANYIFSLNENGELYSCLFEPTVGEEGLSSWNEITFSGVDYVEDICVVNNRLYLFLVRNGEKTLEMLGDFISEDILQENYVALDNSMTIQEKYNFKSYNNGVVEMESVDGLAVGDKLFFTSILDVEIKKAGEITEINGTTVTVSSLDYDVRVSKENYFGSCYKYGITVDGLEYLNGQTVDAVVNNNELRDAEVTNGTIDLQGFDVWSCQVGVRITSKAKSVNLSLDENKIIKYNISKLYLLTYRSLGGEVKTNFSTDYKKILSYTPSVPYTTYISLEDKNAEVGIKDSSTVIKNIEIKHDNPFPFYVISYYMYGDLNERD